MTGSAINKEQDSQEINLFGNGGMNQVPPPFPTNIQGVYNPFGQMGFGQRMGRQMPGQRQPEPNFYNPYHGRNQ